MNLPVLIVGAGPGGLVLACDLARRGVRLRIIERDARPPDYRSGSRGKGMQPRTLEVYDDLGMMPAVRAAGGAYFPGMGWSGSVRTGEIKLPRTDPKSPTPDVPYPSPWMLPQPRALDILRNRLKELGGEVEFGAQLLTLAQDGTGVTATVAHVDGTTETIRCAFLIGADGARGATRAAADIPFVSESTDQQPMVTADVVIAGLERNHWHMWDNAPGGALWLLPLAQTEAFQLYAKYDHGEPDVTDEGLRRMIHERTGNAGFDIREIWWASTFSSRLGMAEQFRKGRVFLVGDAAHIHPPAGGQGMNTSVQDSFNLGWKLGQVLLHGAPDSLLDTYEEERLPIAANLLQFVSQIHKNWMGTGGKGQPLGDSQQIGLNYRGGTLIRHEPTDGLIQAGDRAPDAPLQDFKGASLRMFDILRGPHFTVLALGNLEPPQLDKRLDDHVRVHSVVEYGSTAGKAVNGALIDIGGHAHKHYGHAVVVVRPDNYLGYASAGSAAAKGAADYLARFFS